MNTSSHITKNNSGDADEQLLNKKIRGAKCNIICSVVIWALIQGAWIAMWLICDIKGLSEMKLYGIIFYLLSICLSLLYVAYAHKKYRIVKEFKNILDTYYHKH